MRPIEQPWSITTMKQTAAPIALILARRLIWDDSKHDIPCHLIRFELGTHPDQWRIHYRRPRYSEAGPTISLVPRITLTAEQVEEANSWLASFYSPGGIPW